jgi:hypothetical protein
MITKNFTYYCTSELVYEVTQTFVEKVSNELSMSAQFDFNKISFELISNEALEEIKFEGQDDRMYILDLQVLQTILLEILSEFDLNCINLFPLHESQQHNEKYICFATNQLLKEEELLVQVLNCTTFENELIEEDLYELMPKDFDWNDFHSEIESELEKQHIEAEFDHLGYDSDYLDFYYKVKLQTITVYCDFSKINTFDYTQIDNQKFEDLLRDKFNSKFQYIDLIVYFDRLNTHNVIDYSNESKYDDLEIESILNDEKIWELDIYKTTNIEKTFELVIENHEIDQSIIDEIAIQFCDNNFAELTDKFENRFIYYNRDNSYYDNNQKYHLKCRVVFSDYSV